MISDYVQLFLFVDFRHYFIQQLPNEKCKILMMSTSKVLMI